MSGGRQVESGRPALIRRVAFRLFGRASRPRFKAALQGRASRPRFKDALQGRASRTRFKDALQGRASQDALQGRASQDAGSLPSRSAASSGVACGAR